MVLSHAAPAIAGPPAQPNFDARPKTDEVSRVTARAADRLRARLGRFAGLSLDDRTGTLRSVGRLDGFLTAPSARDGTDVALDYVRDHTAAFGLDGNDLDGVRLVRRTFVDGVEHLTWGQRYRGIPVADAQLEAAVTGAGHLVALSGPPAADVAVDSIEPIAGAREAYTEARRNAGAEEPAVAISDTEGGVQRRTRFADGGRAALSIYRSGDDYRLAWRVLTPVSATGVYDVLVDARSGEAVRRTNRVNFANAKVFRYTPAHEAQVDHELGGWVSPGSDALSGPNVHAFADVHDVVPIHPATSEVNFAPETGSDVGPGNYENVLQTVPHHDGDRCTGQLDTSPPPPTFACTWNPLEAYSWEANRAQSVTQLFYFVNVFAEHLRNDPDIAFTEGGFERTPQPMADPEGPLNPAASDPVLAQALDGSDTDAGLPDADHLNNANFLTLPDGLPGLMQMYLWEPPFGGYDGANDATLVFHEYTHGLSNRLVTDSEGFGALNTVQAGALGEGWSDFYAMDYLEAENLETDDVGTADVHVGGYLDNGTGVLVRNQAIDCLPASAVTECPNPAGPADGGGLTYADFGKVEDGPEVHSDGEIWGQTLWSIRSALIATHGRAAGISRTRRYITQAMRRGFSPPEPSYLEMRNAILLSAALADGTDIQLLWSVFAERGMGWSATTGGSHDETPSAAFDLPPVTTTGDASGVAETSATLNGTIDPDGRQTSYRFEFGQTSKYARVTPDGSVGGDAPVGVAATVTGLEPGTTYHFRVVALNGAAHIGGQDRTFTTLPAPSPPPEPTPTPSPTVTPPPPLAAPPTPTKLTALLDTTLKASRKGFFKVSVLFGDAAPAGDARFTVLNSKRKRLARATTPVRAGRNVTKTLRLSKKGRRAIKPGRSKRITLELRLPNGQKLKKSLRLARSKR